MIMCSQSILLFIKLKRALTVLIGKRITIHILFVKVLSYPQTGFNKIILFLHYPVGIKVFVRVIVYSKLTNFSVGVTALTTCYVKST